MSDRTTLRRREAALGLIALTASGGSVAKAAAARVSIVRMDASSFVPAIISIKVGDTVRWVNPHIMPHTVSFAPAVAKSPGLVVLPPGVEPFESATLDQDDEFSHLFSVKGTYGYVCRFHQRMGMVGKVIVT